MTAMVAELDAFSLPRVTQLINKSNQFHLTTTRYTEGQLREMMVDPDCYSRCFTLEDKFGSNGLIAALILQRQGPDTLYIDTWVMSCRVLARGMEEFIIEEIVSQAEQMGINIICGKYIPTKKNKLVADLYPRLQFAPAEQGTDGSLWRLDLAKNRPQYSTHIRKQDAQLA
jgi:FkbH-like protein